MTAITPALRERVAAAAVDLERATPQAIVAWAYEELGDDLVLSSSFGADSAALLHMANEVVPGIRVAFLDTGWHFPETLAFRDEIVERLGLNVVNLVNAGGHEAFLRDHGELWRADTNRCCHLNKVEPWRHFLLDEGVRGWIAGLRRETGGLRAAIKIVEIKPVEIHDRPTRELLKIHPLANWTKKQVWSYIFANDLPYNPLADMNYGSVGCWPCTRALREGESERDGRWAGDAKTECGLHVITDEEVTAAETAEKSAELGSDARP